MTEGLLAAAEMCDLAASVHARQGEQAAAEALSGMALSLRLRAQEEDTPVEPLGVAEWAMLAPEPWWRRLARWIVG